MFVSQVRLYQFRNLVDQSVELDSGPVFITGNNGNGKTNFVEAIYLLSGSRSFRTNAASEFVKWGAQSCSVFGKIVSSSDQLELGLVFHPGKREGLVNGNPVENFGDFLGRLSVVSFSPADLLIVKGSPQGRRKFLDRHMVDQRPSFLKCLMSYQRALANKNSLLKQNSVDPHMLAPWNVMLADYGAVILRERISFLQRLQDVSARYHKEYANTDGELTVSLESDFNKHGEMEREAIYQHFMSQSSREIAQRVSVCGVHRDDVAIEIGGTDARAYASQGQTRSVILSLKLGVIDLVEEATNEAPVILLDDVDSELDATRGARLFEVLLEKERQILVTGTGKPPYQLASVRGLQTLKVVQGVIAGN